MGKWILPLSVSTGLPSLVTWDLPSVVLALPLDTKFLVG